jgi:hypothetical protein
VLEHPPSVAEDGQMPRISFQDVIDALEHVDDPDVLEKAQGNAALWLALDMSRPKNWQGTGIKPNRILDVAKESGIPVAWVPPADVLKELASEAPADRMAVIRSHAGEIITQCDQLLSECRDNWLGDKPALVGHAIAALKAGHHEAAMALAVSVGEELALWASVPHVLMFNSVEEQDAWTRMRRRNNYKLAETELAAVGTQRELSRVEILRHALIAPIPKFFAPFYARPGETIPATVSRHATVHKPTLKHLSSDNALLAIMLVVSILREQQAWCERVRDEEAFAEEAGSWNLSDSQPDP